MAVATAAGAVLRSTQSDKKAPVDRLKNEEDRIEIFAVEVFPSANNTRIIFDDKGKASEEPEVPRIGDRITVRGHLVLRASTKVILSFKLWYPKKYIQPLLVPLPSTEVQKGERDFQLSCLLPREGNLFLLFLSIPEGRPFPESFHVASILPAKSVD